jgi:hypothetical protein
MIRFTDTEQSRADLFTHVHPAVEAMGERYQLLLDAYDGLGGFLTGGYLLKFPREKDDELTERKKYARYHNYVQPIIDQYVRKLFGGTGVARSTKSVELDAWWRDVDGAGTAMTPFMKESLAKALTTGHVGVLVDKTPDAPTGPSKADEKARVFLTRFLPSAILDWRVAKDEQLLAIKLKEQRASTDILDTEGGEDSEQALLWDRDEWLRVPKDADLPVQGPEPNPLKLVPFEMLRPLRSTRWPFVGAPLLGDGAVIQAIYNRASEEDTVLRDQACSVFVVSLPVGGEVTPEQAMQLLGNVEIGTKRGIVSWGSAGFQTADMEVPKVLQEAQTYLVRELYRMAALRYESDSREAQTAEAIRLQHQELTSMLHGIAAELTRVELSLARFYFHWTSATAEEAERKFTEAEVTVTYPREFFEPDLEKDLANWGTAATAVPSATWKERVAKLIVRKMDPSLSEAELAEIDAEIAAGVAQQQQQQQQAQAGRLNAGSLRANAAARLAEFAQPADGEAA